MIVAFSENGAPRRATSFALEPREGAHSGTVAWTSRKQWLALLDDYLTLPHAVDLRKDWKIAVDKVRQVADVDSRAADAHNGRDLRTSHATVARLTGLSVAAVRRARGFLEAAGWSVTVVRGRYLSAGERSAAIAAGAPRQRRVASTRALVIPRSFISEHLPRSGSVNANTSTSSVTTNKRKRSKTFVNPTIAAKRLVAKMVQRAPHLDGCGRVNLNTLARVADDVLGSDVEAWTAQAAFSEADRVRGDDPALRDFAAGSGRVDTFRRLVSLLAMFGRKPSSPAVNAAANVQSFEHLRGQLDEWAAKRADAQTIARIRGRVA